MTSRRHSHRDADWTDPVPGAIAVGLGVAILQVVAAYMFGPYTREKQGTDEALGLAAALLLGLWALGRLLVGAAKINAALWERKGRETE
jgi:hypothetical protein